MSEITHVDDDLAALVSGELGGERTRQVAAHLHGCPDCAAALVDAAVAVGALRALRALRRSALPADGPRAEPETPPAPLRRRRAARTPWLAVAASVLALAGVAVGIARWSAPSTVAVARLHHLAAPSGASGRVAVTLVGTTDDMRVTTRGLPHPATGDFYEVWLLEPATGKMLPVGVLPPSGQGDFAVAASLMAHYSAVDVSLQADDGDPAHSSVSALRGAVTLTS